jgi:hypothetical protein
MTTGLLQILHIAFSHSKQPFSTRDFSPQSCLNRLNLIHLSNLASNWPLLELKNVESPNIKAWARAKNLPYQRLLARYNGRPSLSERPPNGRKLDESQESALCRYINFLDSIFFPPKRPIIAAAANAILASCHSGPTKPPTIGDHWLRRFLQRHPEYLSSPSRSSH